MFVIVSFKFVSATSSGLQAIPKNVTGKTGSNTANVNVNTWRWAAGIAAAGENPNGNGVLLDDELDTVKSLYCYTEDDPQSSDLMNLFPAHYLEHEVTPRKDASFRPGGYMRTIPQKDGPPDFEFGYAMYKTPAFDPTKKTNDQTAWTRMHEVVIDKIPFGTNEKESPEMFNDVGIAYTHMSADTEKYTVLPLNSLRTNYAKRILEFDKLGYFGTFDWQEDIPMHFAIFDQTTGELVHTIVAQDPAITFHLVNCWDEDENTIICDLTWTSQPIGEFNPELAQNNFTTNLQNHFIMHHTRNTLAGIRRFVMDLTTNTATERFLTQEIVEFPIINFNYFRSGEYRYFYGVGPWDQHVCNNRDEQDGYDVCGDFFSGPFWWIRKMDVDTNNIIPLQLRDQDEEKYFNFFEPQLEKKMERIFRKCFAIPCRVFDFGF